LRPSWSKESAAFQQTDKAVVRLEFAETWLVDLRGLGDLHHDVVVRQCEVTY
jgi:hypothetical protein